MYMNKYSQKNEIKKYLIFLLTFIFEIKCKVID